MSIMNMGSGEGKGKGEEGRGGRSRCWKVGTVMKGGMVV
jgi:hypothetical protein